MDRCVRRGPGLAFGIALALLVLAGPARSANSPQVPLPGAAIPQFAQPLPVLDLSCATGDCVASGGIPAVLGNQPLTLRMCEFESAVLPPGTFAAGVQPRTWTWGYLVDPTGVTPCADLVELRKNPGTGVVESYLGPVLVNERGGGSTDITWVNDLGVVSFDPAVPGTNVLAYKYGTDPTLHWADPLAMQMDHMSNECMMLVEMGMFPGPTPGTFQTHPPPGHPCSLHYGEAAPAPIAAAPHLHGGEQPAEIDGSPDSWWTSDGQHFGHKFYSYPAANLPANAALYRYPNTQDPAPVWFHDHTLGATRLNVYAGLAGGYYIQDPAMIPVAAGGTCTVDCLPANLHPLTEVVPLVLQDRMFDNAGQLFLPAGTAGGVLWSLNPEHPYWNPEFVGDAIVVNGKAWPYHPVERKRYRFLFVNGSNARTYELALVDPVTGANGPPLWVIGTDGGYLDAPVKVDPAARNGPTKLVIQPGERYEVIVDFGDAAWLRANRKFSGSLVLRNTGRTPYPRGPAPAAATVGRILKFVVAPGTVVDASYNPAIDGPLRRGTRLLPRLVNPATGTLAGGVVPAKTRVLTLNEVMMMAMTVPDPVTGALTAFPGGPFEILVNNTKWSGRVHGAAPRPDFASSLVGGTTTDVSELSVEGDTEIWEIVNLTADAHPIHLHLVQFQLLNRQSFNTRAYTAAYDGSFGSGPTPLPAMCTPGVYCPSYGPPLHYDPLSNPLSGGKYGGNPNVTPYLTGAVQPPLPHEAGWKDTAINLPGTVTRYAVRWAPNALPVGTPAAALRFPFDPSGGATGPGTVGDYNYVWHCHIIDHEDNEMMRPNFVTLNPAAPAPTARELVGGVDY